MTGSTAEYGFDLPEDGGDDDVWGVLLNGNWTAVDAILKGLSDAIAANAASLTALDTARKIPVGGLYLSTVSTNPATALGYGTWTAYAQGRALIGVGNNGESDWTAGEERGSEEHTLTEDELADHVHNIIPPMAVTEEDGEHHHRAFIGGSNQPTDDGLPVEAGDTRNVQSTGNNGSLQNFKTGGFGEHSHELNIDPFDSESTGLGDPHNNVQPSIAVYVWRRTA